MKPKEMITALIALGLGLSASAFASEVMTNFADNTGQAFCSEHSFYRDATNKRVVSRHSYNIRNNTSNIWSVRVTYRSCSGGLPCEVKTYDHVILPHTSFVSGYMDMYLVVNYKNPGYYKYTVSTDLEGDVRSHTENTCNIVILK